MIGDTLEAVAALRFLAHDGGQPKHLLATAEFILYFADALPDMKVTGIALWKRDGDAAVTLTLPAGPGSAGEYYCFRPLSGEIKDAIRFKTEVVSAYHAWAAAHPGSGDNG